MQIVSALRRHRVALGTLAAWLLPPLVPLLHTWIVHRTSRAGVVLHAVLLVVLLAALLLATGLDRPRPDRGRARRALAFGLLAGSLQSLLVAFHLLNAIAFPHWGGPLSLGIVRTYAGDAIAIADDHGLVTAPRIALAIALPGLCVAAWTAIARRFPWTRAGIVANGSASGTPRGLRPGLLAVLAVGALQYAILHRAYAISEPLHQFPGGTPPHQVPPKAYDFTASRASHPYLASVPPTPPARRRHVVLVTVDALRAPAMHVYGAGRENTPFLSRLRDASRLQVVHDARAVCTMSLCGLLGTLSSRTWETMSGSAINLIDVLHHHGWRTRAYLSGDHTNFFAMRTLYGPHVDDYRDLAGLPAARVNEDHRVLDAMERDDWDDGRSYFVFVHLMSVHALAPREPRFLRWTPAHSRQGLRSDGIDGDAYRNAYDNGILQVDAMIERLFGLLEARGLLADATVLITADHGEEIGEQGHYGHGWPPYEPLARIPLLVHPPIGTPALAPPALPSQLDVAPTLATAAGVPLPGEWLGVPLQAGAVRDAAPIANHAVTGAVARLDGRLWKGWRDRRNGRWTVFDLSADPAETHDLADTGPGRAVQPRLEAAARALAGQR